MLSSGLDPTTSGRALATCRALMSAGRAASQPIVGAEYSITAPVTMNETGRASSASVISCSGSTHARVSSSDLDRFEPYLARRWHEGCRVAVLLFDRLWQLGYSRQSPGTVPAHRLAQRFLILVRERLGRGATIADNDTDGQSARSTGRLRR